MVKTSEQQAVKLLVDTIGFIHRLSRIEGHTSNNALTGSNPSRPFSSTQPAAPLPPLLSRAPEHRCSAAHHSKSGQISARRSAPNRIRRLAGAGVDAKCAPSAKHTASRTSWLHTCKESQDVPVNFSWKLTKDKVVKYQSLELTGWYQTVPYLRP
jgi:hypothetical protein